MKNKVTLFSVMWHFVFIVCGVSALGAPLKTHVPWFGFLYSCHIGTVFVLMRFCLSAELCDFYKHHTRQEPIEFLLLD